MAAGEEEESQQEEQLLQKEHGAATLHAYDLVPRCSAFEAVTLK